MNNKVLAGIAVVVIVVVVAAVVVYGLDDDDDHDYGTEVTVGVNYYGNGGHVPDGGTVYGLTSETVMSNLFSQEGMIFTGWNTSPDGTGTSYQIGESISYGDGAVSLYAQWAYAFTLGNVSSSGSQILVTTAYLIYDDGTREPVTTYGVALPDDGMGRLEIRVNGITGWEVDSDANTIVGVDSDGNECTVTVTMDEVTSIIAYVDETSGYGGFLFSFDEGPVSCDISVSLALTV